MKIDIPSYEERETAGVQITIHKWDTWNMDQTLALIIHPMLVQLKRTTHGYPNDLTEERWNEILDEMIWSFEQKIKHDDPFDACHDKCANYGDPVCKACLDETQERMSNGFKLFGEYYENLWD